MFWNSASAQEWDFTAQMFWWYLVPSPRRDIWWAKPSLNKPPGSPIWSTKYYKSVEFFKLQNVRPLCTDVKPPYWRLSGDDSGGTAHFRNLEENWFQNLRFVGSNASFSLMLLFRHAKTTVGQGEQYKSWGKRKLIKNKQIVTNIFVSVQQQYWPRKQ